MKKFTLVTLILLFTILIFTPACKSWNIAGVWTFTLHYPFWGDTYNGTITFTGSEDSGTTLAIFPGWDPGNGTYTVSGDSVTFSIFWPSNSNTTNCTGQKTDDNNMSGNLTETGGATGTWTATR